MGRPCLCVQRASGQVNGALVSSQEHSVSQCSVRSLTRPVNLSVSVNFSFLSGLQLFPAVSLCSPLISSCLTSSFLLAASRPPPVFSLSLCCQHIRPLSNIKRQIRRSRCSILSAHSPALFLTDNQKSESAGLAAHPPSFIPLFSLEG